MTDREDAQLKVLQILAKRPSISQRELAHSLGVSVGKVNYLVRGLAEVGAIKARNFVDSNNKLAYAYLLTPRGMSQKLAMTKRYLQRRKSEYESIRREIASLQRQIDDADGHETPASKSK